MACVHAGGVLAVPTDSFYALAAGVFQPSAIQRLAGIKGNRDQNPFPVLIGDISQLDQLVQHVPEVARMLMKQFWPGLLTLVLKAQMPLSPILISGQDTIGVRQPNNSQLCELLKQAGPLTGTSANRTGDPAAQSVEDVIQQVGSEIDLILDGGSTPGGQPSTVLQVEPELRILRQGAISLSALHHVLENERF